MKLPITWTQNVMQAIKNSRRENTKVPSVGFEPVTLAVPGMLKNVAFSTAVHRVSDIIRNVRRICEISDTRLRQTQKFIQR